MAKQKNSSTPQATKTVVLMSFLLDETGSMESVKAATISGFNEYVGSLKKRDELTRFTLTLFNSGGTRTMFQALPVQAVGELDENSYKPDNTTPLYDAIAAAIHKMDADVEAALKRGETDLDILFVIMTDGLENASQTYNRAQVFDLITARRERGWSFVFLGSNQDAWSVGSSIGVAASHSMKYSAGSEQATFGYAAASMNSYLDKREQRRAAFAERGAAAAEDEEMFDVQNVPVGVINPNDADLQKRKQEKARGEKNGDKNKPNVSPGSTSRNKGGGESS